MLSSMPIQLELVIVQPTAVVRNLCLQYSSLAATNTPTPCMQPMLTYAVRYPGAGLTATAHLTVDLHKCCWRRHLLHNQVPYSSCRCTWSNQCTVHHTSRSGGRAHSARPGELLLLLLLLLLLSSLSLFGRTLEMPAAACQNNLVGL